MGKAKSRWERIVTLAPVAEFVCSPSPDPGSAQTAGAAQEVMMADDKSKRGAADRRRIASKQPYEVEDFHQKHKHLTHKQARDIIMKTKGNRAKADAEARSLKK
jgi:hypothetical protein